MPGAVNVQYGAAGGLAGNGQVLSQGTPEDGDLFGTALAKGFFNDDDFVDLAVGAPGEDVGRTDAAGVVIVFYGSAEGLTGPAATSSSRPTRRTATASVPPWTAATSRATASTTWPSAPPARTWGRPSTPAR